MTTSRLFLAALILAATSCARGPFGGAARTAGPLRLEPVGRFDFESPEELQGPLAPEELSGIVWIGDDDYLVVGDDHATVHRLEILLDRGSGTILAVRFGEPVPLRDGEGRLIPDSLGADREGIAYDPGSKSVWISNEHLNGDQSSSSIARHRLRDGRMTQLLSTGSPTMLRVFARQRLNGGCEALTRRPDGSETWTANEMPLSIDGEGPTDSTGALVRLQKFDERMKPVAQYPYRLDPYAARITAPPNLSGFAVNGLSELLALPDGRLLALERSFAGDTTGMANLRVRIYEVTLSGATEISGLGWAEGLAGRAVNAAGKRLLWEANFGLTVSNFEGMTLGPALDGGERIVLLVADNNGGKAQALFALRLHGLPP